MARGWESKSVADQIEEVEQRSIQRLPDAHTPEARLRREQIKSLNLSRSRTLAQLERAAQPAHRQMLESALQALEQQLEELSRADK